jgi:hypothetical protein|nr:MAG TPA: PipA protein [Caudoviricetes sp.]
MKIYAARIERRLAICAHLYQRFIEAARRVITLNTKDLFNEWKKRLRLQDWIIHLEDDVSPADMSDPDNVGETNWCESTKLATIKLMSESGVSKYSITPIDKEKVLVHELMHLKLSLLDDSGNRLQDRVVHQLVDDLALALVDAKRKGAPKTL